jgi:hypothetical protein
MWGRASRADFDMKFSPPPDLSSNRRLAIAALAVTLVVIVGLIWHSNNLIVTLGDTDDAMRLVFVRDLLSGRGWYDQLDIRLQPPTGVYMHWSRLLDGALAGVMRIFGLAMSPPAAEVATRFSWPLLWIFPAVFCALTIALRLGGSLAVFVCAVLLASNQQPFVEFVPGRIDHHNIQIVMIMIAMACAVAHEHRSGWALVAGASTGLGLAIGVEALPFHALVGASYAMRGAIDRGDNLRTARNYAIALFVTTLTFYCLQTPPWRWPMSFCDSLGINLVAAIAVATGGSVFVTVIQNRTSMPLRIAVLFLIALAASGVYLAFDPSCIRGPLASIDPRLLPLWNFVEELEPLPTILKQYRDLGAALTAMSILMMISAAILLVREWPRPRPEAVLLSAAVMLAVAAGYFAFRMENYAFWLGFPLLATGFGFVATRLWRGLMVPTVAVCVFLSPVGIRALAQVGQATTLPTLEKPALPGVRQPCHDTAAYRQLAALRPGLVLADINMGPFILANTRDSVLAAPYHRMTWGILAAHDAFSATSSKAKMKIRDLKIDYVVECSTNPMPGLPGSIEADLARARIPSWLRVLSTKGQALQIYAVRTVKLDGLRGESGE